MQDLRVAYGPNVAVDALSFNLDAGAALAIVGASGSGKSQTALALLGLSGRRARTTGSVRFEGAELVGATPAQLAAVRGARIGMVFQDSLASLNPHLTLGRQVGEVLEQHRGLARTAALREALRLLQAVQIADAARRLFQYPHEISGGMRQRVAIAMALAASPKLLIADEPTSALDMTVQAQVLELLAQLRRELGLALLLITHDFGVVEALCERVLVLQRGQGVETGPTEHVLARPQHEYTRGLLSARPVLHGARADC
ncbi:MAG TPA: ABC transporter ATP-binding protein [Verrucomicrobiae bacterium]|nr:ABC transporter ATP-binding protein [Verrucomicrobiae bacterium]